MSALAELQRLFVYVFVPRVPCAPRRVVGDKITTNQTCTPLRTVHVLARKGWIRYEQNDGFRNAFGVLAWDCELTDAGRAILGGES